MDHDRLLGLVTDGQGTLRSKRPRPSLMWLAQQTHELGSDVILEVQNCNCWDKHI